MEPLVTRLKPWVTTFSAAKHNHGDSVIVGGEVIEIQDLRDLFGTQEVKIGNEVINQTVSVILDDSVGLIKLTFIREHFDIFKEQLKIKKGDIVVAEGRVWNKKTETSFVPSKTRVATFPEPPSEYNTNIICYNLKPLPKTE